MTPRILTFTILLFATIWNFTLSAEEKKGATHEWILIRKSESVSYTEILRAKSYSKENFMAIVTGTNGIQSKFPSEEILAELPAAHESMKSMKSEQLQTILSQYESARNALPENLKNELTQEINQISEFLTEALAAEKVLKEQAQAELDAWLEIPYHPKATYSFQEALSMVEKGQSLASKAKEYRQEEVKTRLQNWSEESKQMLAGLQKLDGEWVPKESKEKWTTQTLPKLREEFFRKNQALAVEAIILDYETTQWILYTCLIVAFIFIVLLLMGLAGLKTGLGIMGLLCMAMGMIMIPIIGYYVYALSQPIASTLPPDPTETHPPSQEEIQKMAEDLENWLYPIMTDRVYRPKEIPETMVITEAQLNALLEISVTPKPSKTPSKFDLMRRGWRLYINSDHWLVVEKISWFNIPLELGYRLPFEIREKTLHFHEPTIRIGSTDAPKDLRPALTESLMSQGKVLIDRTKILDHYFIEKVETGTIYLTRKVK